MSEINLEEIRAQIEAELRIKIEQEFNDRANSAVNASQIAEQRGSVVTAVYKVLEGAGVKPVIQHGPVKYYDPSDVRRAFIHKDKNVLKYWGLLHMVEGEVSSPVEVEQDA
jgi:hypothetical protein